jgi:PST family polysaccharide transporter
MEQQFKTLALRSVGWLAAKRILSQLLLTGANLILVRLLFPSDFGAFAIIMFIVTLSWVFADLGLGRALVQRREEPTPVLLRSVWWTQVGLGILVALALSFLAPIILSYYKGQLPMREVVGWLRWLAVSQILVNMTIVSAALLERRLAYGRVLVGEILGLLATQALTLVLAYGGFGVGSFVFGVIVGRVVSLISFFLLSPWSWGVGWEWGRLKELLSFGLPFQMSGWIGMLNGAVVPVFVGRFPGPGTWSGPEAVGFVTWASGVAAISAAVAGIIEQVLFPLMSRLQGDPALAGRFFRRSLRVVSVATLGSVSLLLALAPEVTRIIYTARWLPGLPSLMLATFQVALVVPSGLAISTLLAFGEAKFYRNIQAFWAVGQWLLAVPLVIYLGFWGVNLAGVLVSATGFVAYLRLRRYFDPSVLKIIKMPLLAAVLTGLVTFSLAHLFSIKNITHLFLAATLGGAFYLFLIYLFMRQDLRQEFKVVKEFSQRFFFQNARKKYWKVEV